MADSGKLLEQKVIDDGLGHLHNDVSESLGDDVIDIMVDLGITGEFIMSMLGNREAIFDLNLSF